MFDIETLRLMLGAVSLVVVILFYAAVYRPTRSSYAGWWTVALLCAMVSPLLLLLNGTDAQVIANPVSSVFAALGGVCVWYAVRSLRGLPPVRWVLVVVPMAVMLFALLDTPATNRWAGNGLVLAVMTLFFSLGARDMWLTWVARRASPLWENNGEAQVALLVSAVASSGLSTFYAWRTIAFAVGGPDSELFERTAGTGPASVVLLVTLATVTFSVVALGYDEQTRELRRRVLLDDLTGLMSRSAFFERAASATARTCARGSQWVLVVADLDHFKSINDSYGHAAGDRALELFATVALEGISDGEFAGRLGGEEFAFLLCSDALQEVPGRLTDLSAEFAQRGRMANVTVPTVSFGVAAAAVGSIVEQVLARADHAMYDAKAAGRNQVVVATSAAEGGPR